MALRPVCSSCSTSCVCLSLPPLLHHIHNIQRVSFGASRLARLIAIVLEFGRHRHQERYQRHICPAIDKSTGRCAINETIPRIGK